MSSKEGMALPGIQAIFAFQMIAMFGERFEALDPYERWACVGSLALVALAVALVVSQRFAGQASSFLAWMTAFLAAVIGSELYLLPRLAIDERWLGTLLGVGLCAAFAWLWFVFPMRRRKAESERLVR